MLYLMCFLFENYVFLERCPRSNSLRDPEKFRSGYILYYPHGNLATEEAEPDPHPLLALAANLVLKELRNQFYTVPDLSSMTSSLLSHQREVWGERVGRQTILFEKRSHYIVEFV